MATLKELRNQRYGLVTEMKALNAGAEKENRSFSAEEREKWNTLNTGLEQIDERIKFAQQLETNLAGRSDEDREQEDRDKFDALKRQRGEGDPNRPLNQYEHSRAFMAWALGRQCNDQEAIALAKRAGYPLGQGGASVQWNLDRGRGPDGLPLKPAKTLDEVRANADARREWRKVQAEKYERGLERRDQSLTAAAGGYTVPDEMMRSLEESLLAWGGMRQVSTIITTATGADLPIPTVDDTAQKGVILAENTGAAEQDVTFAQIVLQAYKYSSKMIQVSVELMQDSSINLAEYLGRALGTRIGRITNDHFTTGTGSSQPNGAITAAGSASVTVASAGTIIFSEPLRLLHAVDPAYRNSGAVFMGHDSTILKLRSMVDGQSRPVWEPSLQVGQPGTLYGYPVVTNQSMASYAATARVLAFGDFSKYVIRDVAQIEIMRLDERYAEAHQVAFLGFSRHDGDLLDAGTDPIKYMVGT